VSDTIRHAVILAAGRGLRMMPLTADRPKAMAPFGGTTLIARGIDEVGRQIENVHVTVGYRAAMLAEHVIHHGARSVINTDGKSNSWWIYHSLLAKLDEPVFVLTCDNVLELDFARLAADYFEGGEPACMLVPVRPLPGLEGDYIFSDGNVVERLSRTEPSEVYCSGVQVLNPARVQELAPGADDGFAAVWERLIGRRQLHASRVYPKQWITADTPAQLQAATDAAALTEERPR
jgi:NDP-sugar pyrophosphorylase family protein